MSSTSAYPQPVLSKTQAHNDELDWYCLGGLKQAYIKCNVPNTQAQQVGFLNDTWLTELL